MYQVSEYQVDTINYYLKVNSSVKGCLLEIISLFLGIFVRFRRFYLYKFYKISIFFIRIGRIELHFALRSIERSGNEIGHLIKSCIHKVFSVAAIRYQSRDV